MSYCRWSSDQWQCDVYVFKHVEGWFQIHVAGCRRKTAGPAFPFGGDGYAVAEWSKAEREYLDRSEEDEWIELPDSHAGESYGFKTAGACADKLEEIRAAGFNVPQYAIDDLRADDAE